MARSNTKPEVFVSMDPEGGTRSVFNGVQTYDGKGDSNDPTTWTPTNKGISPPLPLSSSTSTALTSPFHPRRRSNILPDRAPRPNAQPSHPKDNRIPQERPRGLRLHHAMGRNFAQIRRKSPLCPPPPSFLFLFYPHQRLYPTITHIPPKNPHQLILPNPQPAKLQTARLPPRTTPRQRNRRPRPRPLFHVRRRGAAAVGRRVQPQIR